MVLLSSDPSTNPFSASVAYLTVLQPIVDWLSDQVTGAIDRGSAGRRRLRMGEGIKRAEPQECGNGESGAWRSLNYHCFVLGNGELT